MKKILILPDIHGRMFWKEPEVQTAWGEATHVVFLGDYLDPYSWERIRWIDAWDNFMEIVEAKKKEPKKVTLLLGNHDYHYAFSEIVGMKGSRYNWDEAPKTTRFFQDNLGLFQFAWSMTNSKGLVYLFTHAGVVGGWVKSNKLVPPASTRVASWLNNFVVNPDTLLPMMWDVSRDRGGYARYGSPIWADHEEHHWNTWREKKIYQVFGHSQGCYHWIAGDRSACLDCRRPFILLPESGIFGEPETIEGNRYWTKVIETSGLPTKEWVDAWINEI